jgi:hypothetical protein
MGRGSLGGTAMRLAALVMLLLTAGCSSASRPDDSPGNAAPTSTQDRTADLGHPAGPCVPAPVRRDSPPPWTVSAGVPSPTPYALGSGEPVAAFFFAYPLRAGHPTSPANKILWVVGAPRNGRPLAITARPMSAPGPAVVFHREADSGPGEIYPSVIDLPTPGCWRLDLRWGSHQATIDMQVHPGTAGN